MRRIAGLIAGRAQMVRTDFSGCRYATTKKPAGPGTCRLSKAVRMRAAQPEVEIVEGLVHFREGRGLGLEGRAHALNGRARRLAAAASRESPTAAPTRPRVRCARPACCANTVSRVRRCARSHWPPTATRSTEPARGDARAPARRGGLTPLSLFRARPRTRARARARVQLGARLAPGAPGAEARRAPPRVADRGSGGGWHSHDRKARRRLAPRDPDRRASEPLLEDHADASPPFALIHWRIAG